VHRGPPVYGGGPYYRGGYYYPYYYPYYYGPYYPHFSFGFYFGYPYGYGAYPYPYPYPYAAYGYGYPAYGGVRIDLPQRDAEVFVDGYYAGVVDQYDGNLQQLNLEPGVHRIEVRAPGWQTLSFDVNIVPGRTVTYRTAMRPAVP
jgi:hypothetical protein